MGHPGIRPDVAGGGEKAVVTRDSERDECCVEVINGGNELKGPFVKAPSDPAPVVDGDLPVMLQMNSMNSSGSSM